jgi:hypothetical protein
MHASSIRIVADRPCGRQHLVKSEEVPQPSTVSSADGFLTLRSALPRYLTSMIDWKRCVRKPFFEHAMLHRSASCRMPLPKSWGNRVKSGVLHVVSMPQLVLAHTRNWAANSLNTRIRLKAELERGQQELAILREETRIKDARTAQIAPQRRPFYPPVERLAILELKAARVWSLEQTARRFLVTAATIASWMNRLDEDGPKALVRVRQPVNKFPDFLRYIVQRLTTLCPALGKQKIAQTLARAGLHLGATPIGWMLKKKPTLVGTPGKNARSEKADRVVTVKYPNHLWHVDLTLVPTSAGMCRAWLTE